MLYCDCHDEYYSTICKIYSLIHWYRSTCSCPSPMLCTWILSMRHQMEHVVSGDGLFVEWFVYIYIYIYIYTQIPGNVFTHVALSSKP